MIISLVTAVWFWQHNRFPALDARGATLLILALVVGLIGLLPVLYLGDAERIYVLKLGAIVFLSLLPGLLYLQFVVVKGLGLRSEYVLALHRLHIDRYENLPTPPEGSLFYRPGPQPPGAGKDNIYLRRFDSYYGRPHTRSDGVVVQAGVGNLLPVLIATIGIATGWTLFLQPEFISGVHLELGGLVLGGEPVLPVEPLRFAFLGAYFYSLEMTRRYFQEDLRPSAYLNALTRMLGSALLVIAVDAGWPDSISPAQELGIAFVIGVFPQIGIKAIHDLIASTPQAADPESRARLPAKRPGRAQRVVQVATARGGHRGHAEPRHGEPARRDPADPGAGRSFGRLDQAHLSLRVSNKGSHPIGHGYVVWASAPPPTSRTPSNRGSTRGLPSGRISGEDRAAFLDIPAASAQH